MPSSQVIIGAIVVGLLTFVAGILANFFERPGWLTPRRLIATSLIIVVGGALLSMVPWQVDKPSRGGSASPSPGADPSVGAGPSVDEIVQRFIYRLPASVRALGCVADKTMDDNVPMASCGSLQGPNVTYYLFDNLQERDDALYYNITDDHPYSKTDCSKGPKSSFYRFSVEGHKGQVLCGAAPDGPTYMWVDDLDSFMGSIATFGSDSETNELWRQAVQVAAK
jgi:hypothetical protein